MQVMCAFMPMRLCGNNSHHLFSCLQCLGRSSSQCALTWTQDLCSTSQKPTNIFAASLTTRKFGFECKCTATGASTITPSSQCISLHTRCNTFLSVGLILFRIPVMFSHFLKGCCPECPIYSRFQYSQWHSHRAISCKCCHIWNRYVWFIAPTLMLIPWLRVWSVFEDTSACRLWICVGCPMCPQSTNGKSVRFAQTWKKLSPMQSWVTSLQSSVSSIVPNWQNLTVGHWPAPKRSGKSFATIIRMSSLATDCLLLYFNNFIWAQSQQSLATYGSNVSVESATFLFGKEMRSCATSMKWNKYNKPHANGQGSKLHVPHIQ